MGVSGSHERQRSAEEAKQKDERRRQERQAEEAKQKEERQRLEAKQQDERKRLEERLEAKQKEERERDETAAREHLAQHLADELRRQEQIRGEDEARRAQFLNAMAERKKDIDGVMEAFQSAREMGRPNTHTPKSESQITIPTRRDETEWHRSKRQNLVNFLNDVKDEELSCIKFHHSISDPKSEEALVIQETLRMRVEFKEALQDKQSKSRKFDASKLLKDDEWATVEKFVPIMTQIMSDQAKLPSRDQVEASGGFEGTGEMRLVKRRLLTLDNRSIGANSDAVNVNQVAIILVLFIALLSFVGGFIWRYFNKRSSLLKRKKQKKDKASYRRRSRSFWLVV